jgi:hypothetical protein
MNARTVIASLVASLAGAFAVSPALAQQVEPQGAPPQAPAGEAMPSLPPPPPAPAALPPPIEQPVPAGPPRYDLIRVNAGFRIGYIPTSGFDQFATSDVLSQFSIDGTYPVFHRDRLVVGVGFGWDVGGREDRLRGVATSLTAHTLSVPVEARWYVRPWLCGFGKVAPGATAMLANVEEGSSPNRLTTTAWAFSANASVGASFLIAPRQHLDKRTPRFWITPEFGYSYTTEAALNLNPNRDAKDLLGSDENMRMASVALSGFFWRATVGTTF